MGKYCTDMVSPQIEKSRFLVVAMDENGVQVEAGAEGIALSCGRTWGELKESLQSLDAVLQERRARLRVGGRVLVVTPAEEQPAEPQPSEPPKQLHIVRRAKRPVEEE